MKNRVEKVYDELVTGIQDYAKKNGFARIVVGLSGGIDSAVTCCLAAAALGSKNVLGLFLPSKYSSSDSEVYARRLAENLGIEFKVVSIGGIYDSYLDILEKDLKGNEGKNIEIYHQNIQARIRGNILMAFSNRFGYLVLATGNRSEAMMGYCTLYGDTVGGLAVLSNVLKKGVYGLAERINQGNEIIPKEIIERIPSAELKPGQRDEDNLPPYDILDDILHSYLDIGMSPGELKEKGYAQDVVEDVLLTIDRTEYKRKQCPPGIKVSEKI
ncbi:MAG: NAD(+) synthase [Candidatus Omnitrophica bacterium]|nr:NAD(+) synthase [Candidatus Omnitrophota bacterium]